MFYCVALLHCRSLSALYAAPSTLNLARTFHLLFILKNCSSESVPRQYRRSAGSLLTLLVRHNESAAFHPLSRPGPATPQMLRDLRTECVVLNNIRSSAWAQYCGQFSEERGEACLSLVETAAPTPSAGLFMPPIDAYYACQCCELRDEVLHRLYLWPAGRTAP